MQNSPGAKIPWLAALCLCSVSLAEGPSDEEAAALRELGRRVKGFVVWESNRTGHWELYRIDTDGSNFRRITDLAARSAAIKYGQYLRPRVSPDGQMILFGYADRHGKPVECWLVPASGGEARSVTRGNPMGWSPDTSAFFFLRDSTLWRHNLASGTEEQVNQLKLPADGSDGNVVGDVRADLGAIVLRSSSNQYLEFTRPGVVKTTGGCEPRFSASGRIMYWVQGPRDFRIWKIGTEEERTFFATPPTKPYDYTYFPTVSDDERWLAYGASPNQHDHNSSDYEIFLQELKDWQPVGTPVRLSWHPRTDRWPYLYVYKDTTPPPTCKGLKAAAKRVHPGTTGAHRTEEGLIAVYEFDDTPTVQERRGKLAQLDLHTCGGTVKRLEGGGMELIGPGHLRTDGNASGLVEHLKGRSRLSVEVCLEVSNTSQVGPARIVSLSADPGRRDFTLGQAGDKLVFRLRTTCTSENGMPELTTKGGTLAGGRVHAVATFDGVHRRIFVNGRLAAEMPTDGDFSSWEAFPLLIGNEGTGDRPWAGRLYLVAIYDRALSPEEIARNFECCGRCRR